MGRKIPAGLFNRNGKWHIDKQIGGRRIRKSCRTSDLMEAERLLAKAIEEDRQAQVFGVRPKRTFEQAAIECMKLKADLKSIASYQSKLDQILPFIGHIPIDEIDQGSLDEWISTRQKDGIKTNTINHGIKIVRIVLNAAATKIKHPGRLTWLLQAPSIETLDVNDAKEPYPLTWDEQDLLFSQLPDHLKDMALFAVNTGCRDQEICHLRWDWEQPVPECKTSVFVIPGAFTKNKQKKFVFLNKITREIIEKRRGIHPEFVFSYRGNGIYQMNNTGWQDARVEVGLADVCVHDLRHTFATRLYELDTPEKDISILLGHTKKEVTSRYINRAFRRLESRVEKLCPNAYGKYPTIILLRDPSTQNSRKYSTSKKKRSAA